MSNFYDSNMIPEILRVFKAKNAVISSLTNESLADAIKKSGLELTFINTGDEDAIEGNPLDVLQDLKDYDSIFIDGDANWYTVFNELNIVKKSNKEFPLVFICNNNFPNKRRDSYADPESIPSEFRQEYTKELPICYNNELIKIVDDYYHACDENTPKNGVLTAIEDFLSENSYISIMKINFIDGITVLYPKTQINEKRLGIIDKMLQGEKTEAISLSDKLIENSLLVSYINKYNEYGENFNKFEDELSKKNILIENYEKEINQKSSEITYKDSQISSIESKLSLKDSQIENFESKLVNNENMISALENQLESASADLSQRESSFNDEISSLKNEFSEREASFNDEIQSLENKLESANADFSQRETSFNSRIISFENKLKRKQDEFNSLSSNIKQKDNQLQIKQQELDDVENKLDNLQHSYNRQLSKLDSNKYCISCFKDEISNNHQEIQYLKNNTMLRKILSPAAYLYLILKSSPKEWSLNINLYKALKDSKCFDIGFYLNKNQDLIDSKWCKYFSPELHYVCKGFREDRLFNKKYFNTNSKKELLDYLLTCDK